MQRLRIGEVARRSGVPVELLRAWERRYGVPTPERSAGGYRLYSQEDVARLAEMRALVANGVSPAQAAQAVSAAQPAAELESPEAARERLHAAIRTYDEAVVHLLLDRLFSTFTVETVLTEVVFPLLHELGERWERGEISVAQEHFASNLVRGRLLGLARGWGRPAGRAALLACPPGEQHDLGLIGFGIALHRLGWRIALLGADSPLDTLGSAADVLRPTVVVLTLTWEENLFDTQGLARLAERHSLALGGRAATEQLARSAGAEPLADDMVAAAAQVAADHGSA
jgi:DNA-binding transcriptional MerR regulator